MLVVAVEHLDVDARIRHAARQLAELSRHRLLEPLDDDVTHREHLDAGRLQRGSRGFTILEEKVRGAAHADDPGAATLDADAGIAERLAHVGECARPVRKLDREILHASLPPQLDGSTSAMLCENVHECPTGSSAVYWRSPYE